MPPHALTKTPHGGGPRCLCPALVHPPPAWPPPHCHTSRARLHDLSVSPLNHALMPPPLCLCSSIPLHLRRLDDGGGDPQDEDEVTWRWKGPVEPNPIYLPLLPPPGLHPPLPPW
uniref:Uncharacterized protein n=1 Tax=Setaria viridis TaxID=4556 RepID=A0A4U6V917_SETVI|nr:hypothetical protein SEVIR_3G088500v2 [Setaria viridis]